MRINPHQRRAIQAVFKHKKRGVIWVGSTGSGKTHGMGQLGVMHAQLPSSYPGLLAGESVAHVMNVYRPILRQVCEELGVRFKAQGGQSPGFYTGDAFWEAHGFKNADSVERIRGSTYSRAILDDMTGCYPGFFWMMRTRLRPPDIEPFWGATMNKMGPRHWTKLTVRDKAKQLNALKIESKLEDNPVLPETFIEDLSPESMPVHEFLRLVENLDALPAGLVYPVWTPATNKHRKLANGPWIMGADHGAARVTSAHGMQRIGPNQWIINKEYYHDASGDPRTIKSAYTHAMDIAKMLPPHSVAAIYPDPSAVDYREALAAVGYKVIPANNHEATYAITHEALTNQRVVVDMKACPALATELESLYYKEGTDTIDPSCADHACDDMRYMVPPAVRPSARRR